LKGGPAKTGKAGWRGMAQTGFAFSIFRLFPAAIFFFFNIIAIPPPVCPIHAAVTP